MVNGSPTVGTISTPVMLDVLTEGDLTLDGLFRTGSNYTFLVHVLHQDLQLSAVYKPTLGERPLWDFPRGTLAKREVAAFLASELLGWNLVPPTVHRDGPHGPGSVQYYIAASPGGNHYFNFSAPQRSAYKRVAVFDYISNNADRKGSHVVCDANGHIWLFDHGVCFHADYKLRTVIWEFAGAAIPTSILADLRSFRASLDSNSELATTLRQLLTSNELDALSRRTDKIIDVGCFPEPGTGRNYPWPPL